MIQNNAHLTAAEKFLESVECNQNYPVLLLHVVDKADVPAHIRVSAAVMFKNYVKRNWRVVSISGQIVVTTANDHCLVGVKHWQQLLSGMGGGATLHILRYLPTWLLPSG